MVFDPARFRRRFFDVVLFGFILAAALAPRLVMMLTVERYLDADESIVGLMGKHISQGEEIPLFFYGQHYGGGHVIEALPAALWREIKPGPSPGAVHASPVIFSTALVLLAFVFFRSRYGLRAAVLASMLLAYSTPFLESSLKADGYVETIFFGVLAYVSLITAERRIDQGAGWRVAAWTFFTGALLGLALWSYDFAVIYLVVLLAAGARKMLRSFTRGTVFAAGLATGAMPAIAYNIEHHFAHLEHLVSAGPGGAESIPGVFDNLFQLFTIQLPAFLTADSVHNFVYPAPWYSWFTYAALGIAVLTLVVYWRRVPAPLAAIPLLVMAAYVVSGYAGRSPRYLLPLEPFLSMSIALAAHLLFSSGRKVLRYIGSIVMALVLVGLAGGAAAVFSDNSIVEGNVKTDPESLVEVADFLEANKVECVVTTYFIKWRLLFIADERINAVDVRARDRDTAYLRYENLGCPRGKPFWFVLHEHSPYVRSLPSSNLYDGYMVKRFRDHLVIRPVLKKSEE